MSKILLRSPRYEVHTNTSSAAIYAIMTLTVDSTSFTLRKDKDSNNRVVFEISELCKDYYDVITDFGGNVSVTSSKVLNGAQITNITKWYNSSNAVVATDSTVTHDGFLGYHNSDVLVNMEDDALAQSNSTIYLPPNTASAVPYLAAGNATIRYVAIGATDTSVTIEDQVITVKRLDSCKFTTFKMTFLNKYGAFQELYFDKKSVESVRVRRKFFDRTFTRTTDGTDVVGTNHEKQIIDVNGNRRIVLNSGYLDEGMNEVFTELLNSELVYLTIGSLDVPINISDSNLTYKTSVNNRLVNFTVNVDLAYKEINRL